jgi:pimeloyl-ACP methyl ester carboxylesterase
VEVSGAVNGFPIFLMHGTPGSRFGPRPKGSALYRLGVRLISYDRPGYGESTPHPGRTVADAATDVKAIAQELGLDVFAVLGRSGGGPHALACAALLPTRVIRTAVLVSVADATATDLNWFDGMGDANAQDFTTADRDPVLLAVRLRVRADETARNPESLVHHLESHMATHDRRVVRDAVIRRQLLSTYREGLRRGPTGWLDDVFAMRRPWGFSLGAIAGPVRLWHGEDDTFSPVGHTHWLARHIPNAEVEVQAGAAHFSALEILPRMLGWLAGSRVA